MKKQLAIIAMGLSLLGAAPFAVASPGQSVAYSQKRSASVHKSIILYAKPSTASRVIAALNPYRVRLIPIYDRGKWVKVGNAHDGTVGWLNKQQYFRTMRAAVVKQKPHYVKVDEVVRPGKQPKVNVYYDGKKLNRPETAKKATSIVVKSVRGRDGKVHIVAYKNGKQLPPNVAEQLYRQMLGPVVPAAAVRSKSLPTATARNPQYAQSYQVPVPAQVEQMMIQSMEQFYRMDRTLVQQVPPVALGQQPSSAVANQQPVRVVVVPVYDNHQQSRRSQ
ncbi:MAG: SH3 domain-containing protein [Gammaproteobacteria bacterium]|nr:SH3 domain-containing protein [Gammaproteobacteria bacterium]